METGAMQINIEEVNEALVGLSNIIGDLLRADYGTYQRVLPKLSRLLHTPPLGEIADSLKSKVNLKKWIEDGNATESSMVGSARLPPPDSIEMELGLVVALIDAIADKTYDMVQISNSFFYTGGSSIASQLQNMTQQLFVGFARDFATYARKRAAPTSTPAAFAQRPSLGSKRVFIVHGHDGGAKETVARFLSQIDLQPVILHEQANRGQTVIEKIESNSDVGFAVVLMTPDDIGGKQGEATLPRARQNVILELGYFIARLGRDRVAALRRGSLETPSDFDGIVYTDFDDAGAWKTALGKELQAVGYRLDWNKLMTP